MSIDLQNSVSATQHAAKRARRHALDTLEVARATDFHGQAHAATEAAKRTTKRAAKRAAAAAARGAGRPAKRRVGRAIVRAAVTALVVGACVGVAVVVVRQLRGPSDPAEDATTPDYVAGARVTV